MRRLLFPTLVLLLAASAAPACPTCKDAAPGDDPSSAQTASVGYNSGIYLTLGGFLGALGFVGYGIVKGVRASCITLEQAG